MKGISLRSRFLLANLALMIILGLVMVFLVRAVLTEKLRNELEKRGVYIATHIASSSSPYVLTDNKIALQMLINDEKESDQGIEYILVLDSSDQVLAHTFAKEVPMDLERANFVGSKQKFSAQPIITEKGNILDIAVPLLKGDAGIVRVGISEEPMEKSIAGIIWLILGIMGGTLVVGGAIAVVLTTVTTRPIRELAEAAKKVSHGSLGQKVQVKTSDEVGELGEAFNKMVESLRKSRDEIIFSKEYADGIIGSMNDSLVAVSQDGNIKTVNSAFCTLLGYEEKELIGQPIERIFADEDFLFKRIGLDSIKQKGTVRNTEETFLSKDGIKVPVFFSSSVMRDNGDIQGVVCVAQCVAERERADEELQLTLDKLRNALEGTIEAMVATVDMRDPCTAGHQRRVANLARAIGIEMGLSLEKINGISMAGAIHDIGKISIPADVINKPGQLTETERRIIQTHPSTGYEILRPIDFPWPVAIIVQQHHERMDGSGYPYGIPGDKILQEARIIGVADVVEAISSHRPYRPALGIQKALDEILDKRGILYDPKVVDACLRLFREKGFVLDHKKSA